MLDRGRYSAMMNLLTALAFASYAACSALPELAFPQAKFESFNGEPLIPMVAKDDARCDAGHLFVTPLKGQTAGTEPSKSSGPTILDNKGNFVWMEPDWGVTSDLKVQNFEGSDYITFWQGKMEDGVGYGAYIMLDDAYRLVKRLVPPNGIPGDFHEFRLTSDGTALYTAYIKKKADLSALGMAKEGWIYDSVFQEVDILSGKLLRDWHASDYVQVEDTYAPRTGRGNSPEKPFDYFRITSLDKDTHGNIVVGSRNFGAVYSISSGDGSVNWQLGGQSNEFRDLSNGEATGFTQVYDVRMGNDSYISMYDGGAGIGRIIEIDQVRKYATLIKTYTPRETKPNRPGSMQVLPSGNVLVSSGSMVTEFSPEGDILCETQLSSGGGPVSNYRAFKSTTWTGKPTTSPDVAVRAAQNGGENFLYVSWNGATKVDSWLLESSWVGIGGPFQGHLVEKATGFETKIAIPESAGEFVRVTAVDIHRTVLKSSLPVYGKIDSSPVKQQTVPQGAQGGGPKIVGATLLIPLVAVVALVVYRRSVTGWLLTAWAVVSGRLKGYKFAKA